MRSLTVSTSRTASSTMRWRTLPARTRAGSCCRYVLLPMSMVTPASRLRAAASAVSAAWPWLTSECTAQASLMTKPLKPMSPRSTSRSSQRLPEAGTSLSVM